MTTRRGFRYDRGSSRLEVMVDGVVAARFNNVAPFLTVVNGVNRRTVADGVGIKSSTSYAMTG
jgi:hypothetical protein